MDVHNIKNEERIKRLFPEYFSQFVLPEGAKPERIKVYRACKSGKCDAISFQPTYEERGFQISEDEDATDPSLYSLSTYEKPTHVKRFANMTSDMQVPFKIAIGFTDPECGVVQRTRERKPKSNSHVDWWLYIGAKPYVSFEIIPDFETHLAEYIKERDEKNVQTR